MQLTSLTIESYTERDDDRANAPIPFEDSIALRLLPGDCTLSLLGLFEATADELADEATLARVLPRLFVTHSEEGGAVAYSVSPLLPMGTQRRDETTVEAHYELRFRPARAREHALWLEVAEGAHIESHDWAIRVRHAYNA